ncbi:conserved hypothetical protein [delta proteobacterium NaphS2]|nr:conserved hypothetical protein [delta proteobacterium NaphS2]
MDRCRFRPKAVFGKMPIPAEVEYYEIRQRRRLSMKPGVDLPVAGCEDTFLDG